MNRAAGIALLATGLILAAPLSTAPMAGTEKATAKAVAAALPVSKAVWNGYRRYNATCNHCHGPDGVGSSFGPSLIDRPLAPEAFRRIVLEGSRSGSAVMKGFGGDPNIVAHIDDIHAYLQARADGGLGRGRPARPE